MIKEEILAMEVGRELDVLVAREIFGVEVEWDYSPWGINKQPPKQPFRKGEPRTVLGPMAHAVLNTICEHSTDISAAWPVVEKMEQDGWNWDASGRIGRNHVKPFTRFYFKPNKYDPVYPLSSIVWADGKELPEAICKAALLTKLEAKNA